MPTPIDHIDPNCFEATAWYRFSSKQLEGQKSAMFGTILLSRNIFVGLRSKWTMKVLQRWCKASQIPWLFNSTSSMQIHASFIWAWRLHLGRHWKHNNHQIWQIFCCAFIFASVSTLFFHVHQFRHCGTSHGCARWTTSLQLSEAQS
jgi:hypothetical protein